MKKFGVFFVAALVGFLLGSYAFAIEWVPTNSSVVTWSPVTNFENGDPIPAADSVEYAVYIVDAASSDKSIPCELGVTSDILYTITLVAEGKYLVGLKTIRKCANGVDVSESVIGWSDDPLIVSEGKTFGLSYFFIPAMVQGLQIK